MKGGKGSGEALLMALYRGLQSAALLLLLTDMVWAAGPVLLTDPISDVTIVEDHSEVLSAWIRKGVRGAALIHIDEHDDIRQIAPERITRLKKLFDRSDRTALAAADSLTDSGLYNIGNFVYAAASLGILREVYWIIPAMPENDLQFRKFLRRNRFSEEQINTFSMHNGCFRGSPGNVPLSLCTPDSLPEPQEPLVVSIDLDFLPALAAEQRIEKPDALRKLAYRLRSKAYQAADVSVSYSVNGGFTSALNRWLGNALIRFIRTPETLSDDPLMPPWANYQAADRYASRLLPAEGLAYVQKPLGDHPGDAALLLYAADFSYLLNDLQGAFRYADRACKAERQYCFGLLHVGRYLTREGRLDEAVRFIEAGASRHPGMLYHQWELGFALLEANRPSEALRIFDPLRLLLGAFPLELFRAEAYLLLGDGERAAAHCDLAIKGLKTASVNGTDDARIGMAIIAAIERFEAAGLQQCASAIK
ncbi:MAG: hypothetical protein EPN25_02610 [Nitrospirae bacterium]|nr:MAG: hypothetical protein EPN25_02610 [Nitrospirota bacterium]